MTGCDITPNTIDGVSIFPLLNKDKMKDRPLFWHYPHYSNQGVEPGSAIRIGKYKLIDNFQRDRQELYDLDKDISEVNDISTSNPSKARELYKILNKWREEKNVKMMVKNPDWNGE
jgi:arylsulfatase A-like enzyme